VIAHSWLAVSGLDYASRLTSFGRRAHIVTGELDASSPPGGVAAHAALFARASSQVVAGAGHLTPYEVPDEFAQIVLRLAADAD
jgi:pimeloyl-ACP methyl ester carboxylesterase